MKIVFFCFFILNLVACTSRPVEPTRTSRHTIDTLFERKVTMLQPEIDSLCRTISAKTYQQVVDSLMDARKSEMNILVE